MLRTTGMASNRVASTLLAGVSISNRVNIAKRCIATVPKERPPRPLEDDTMRHTGRSGRSFNDIRRGTVPAQRQYYLPPADQIIQHLESTFTPLRFPEELALRIATHKSAAGALGNHNSRLSLLGRRFLRFTTAAFLNLHSNKLQDPNYISHDTLIKKYQTYELGNYVGRQLALQKSMRWLAVRDHEGLETGLFTIRGAMVEAVIGGVFRQYGATEAQNLIYAYIFPHLLLPSELSEVVDEARKRAATELGKSCTR